MTQKRHFLSLFIVLGSIFFIVGALLGPSSAGAAPNCSQLFFVPPAKGLPFLSEKSASSDRQARMNELFKISVAMRSRLASYLAHYQEAGFPNRAVATLHLLRIKDLNEKILGTIQTEAFLEHLHLVVARATAGARKSDLLEANYKSHYIATDQSERDFRRGIGRKIFADLEQWLKSHAAEQEPQLARLYGTSVKTWRDWLNKSLLVGYGKDLIESHFDLFRKQYNANSPRPLESFEQWRSEALATRAALLEGASERRVPFQELLSVLYTSIKKGDGGTKRLRSWLKERKASDLFLLAQYYNDLLQLGDFLPLPHGEIANRDLGEFMRMRSQTPLSHPRGSWSLELRIALENGVGADWIVVLDVRGLGLIGRMAQDRWIQEGAQTENLTRVYSETERTMEAAFQKLLNRLEGILGNERLETYRTQGDEIAFFLKHVPAVDRARVVLALNDFLAKEYAAFENKEMAFRLHTSGLVPVQDPSQVSGIYSAYQEARNQLDLKKHLKAEKSSRGLQKAR